MTTHTPAALTPPIKRTRNKHNVTFAMLRDFLLSPPTMHEATLKGASDFFHVPMSTLSNILFRNNTSVKEIRPFCLNEQIALCSYNNGIEATKLRFPDKTLKQIHSIRYNYRRKYKLTPELKPCPQKSQHVPNKK